ncbi:MAG TPA: CHAT domain-containing protein [Thermoanaerobaculia bacterium]|jgi:CHAT domain-containing protein|nr:CHAT domain-containing protein [Thermoanaerobaculia bacterium]
MSTHQIEQQISVGVARRPGAHTGEAELTLGRHGKIAVTSGAVVALLAMAFVMPAGQQVLRRAHRAMLLHELRGAAADAGVVIPYITEWRSMRAATMRGEPRPPEARRLSMRAAADNMLVAAQGDDTADAHYAAGVAQLVTGDREQAIASFQSAVARDPGDARATAALAETLRRDAVATGRPAELCAALAAAHRALAQNDQLPAARHAWAAVLDDLGIEAQARAAWAELLSADPAAEWRPDIEKRLAAPPSRSEVQVWMEVAYKPEDVAKLSEEGLRAVVLGHPEMARGWVESQYLTDWATAYRSGDRQAAAQALTAARRVATEVRAIAGETLAAEAVAVIDDATRRGDSERLALLAQGQIAYQNGRKLLSDDKTTEGIQKLTSAAADLRSAGSPLAAVATHYAITGSSAVDQAATASKAYRDLLDSEAGRDGHMALRAQSLRELGLTVALLGRWNEAMSTLQASATLFERLGETNNLGISCLDISGTLDQLGQPEAAWRERIKAFRLFSETGQTKWIETTLADAALFSIASRDWNAAHAFATLDVDAVKALAHPLKTSRAWMRKAIIEVNSGEDATQSLLRANAAAKNIAEGAERTRAEIGIVEALSIQQRKPADAAGMLGRSIAFYAGRGLNVFLPDVYLLRSRAFAAAGDDGAAWKDVTSGIAMLENQRLQVDDVSLRNGLFDRACELFDDAVRLALRRGDTVAAFTYADKGRSRALLDTLGDGTPRAAENIAAIQSSLGDGVLVEFHALPEKLVTFVVSREGLQTFEHDVASAELERRVSMFVSATIAQTAVEELQRSGGELFDLLLAKSTGNSSAPLVIVADGPLRSVPFAALYDRVHGQYVMEARPLTLTPSAAVFVDRTRALSERGGAAPRSVLAIGDPSFDNERFSTLARLPGSGREARAIAPLYATSTVWRAEEATKKRFASEATRFDVVHFGGHAVSNHVRPAASFLLFAAGAKSEKDDGALYSSEIVRMRFASTRIVVLAACESLHGDPAGREGLPTIGRSFLEAGVPTVIGTLWPIDDDVSANPLVVLHRKLAGGVPADEAVRAVQLAMLHSGDPSQRHPSQWAAFAVLGAARTRDQ